MRVLGYADRGRLFEMAKRGMSPKAAVDALIDEAKRRHPDCKTVIVRPNGDGFEIVGF